jgi:hypothetical protein
MIWAVHTPLTPEQVDQQLIECGLRIGDLMVARLRRRTARPQLHPVQRALAGQRFGDLTLAHPHGQQRILPQWFVIIEIFVAQRQAVDPPELVLDR